MNCIAIKDQGSSLESINKLIKKNPELQLLATFDNGLDALKFIEKNKVNFIFTDAYNSVAKQEFFFADANGKRLKINFKDIFYIESAGNYVLIVGQQLNIVVYKSMTAMQQLLTNSICIRIHKSYIISIDCIEAIKGNECIIRITNGKKIIPIGNKFRNEFLNKLEIKG